MTPRGPSKRELEEIAEMLFWLRTTGHIPTRHGTTLYFGEWTPEQIDAEVRGVLQDMEVFLYDTPREGPPRSPSKAWRILVYLSLLIGNLTILYLSIKFILWIFK
jgi:hypothetical protein